MSIDPNNPVVKLCVQGIDAEMKGDINVATALYKQAWVEKTNDFEACIVAHYMARIQSNLDDILKWNIIALNHADKVTDSAADAFYPSLYLNIAKAYEEMGNKEKAREYYQLGASKLNILPATELGDITRNAIAKGLERVK